MGRLVEAWGVELHRHGADLVGRCPFHDDREPSLVITPSKNLWHCMGACQTGGDAYAWTMKDRGVTFPQAHMLRLLDPERPLPMSALAERLFCDASNVTGLADRLESRGLVRRQSAEGDRRVKALTITPAGIALRKQVLAIMTEPPAAFDGGDREFYAALHRGPNHPPRHHASTETVPGTLTEQRRRDEQWGQPSPRRPVWGELSATRAGAP